jgi:hypothetical protein
VVTVAVLGPAPVPVPEAVRDQPAARDQVPARDQAPARGPLLAHGPVALKSTVRRAIGRRSATCQRRIGQVPASRGRAPAALERHSPDWLATVHDPAVEFGPAAVPLKDSSMTSWTSAAVAAGHLPIVLCLQARPRARSPEMRPMISSKTGHRRSPRDPIAVPVRDLARAISPAAELARAPVVAVNRYGRVRARALVRVVVNRFDLVKARAQGLGVVASKSGQATVIVPGGPVTTHVPPAPAKAVVVNS